MKHFISALLAGLLLFSARCAWADDGPLCQWAVGVEGSYIPAATRDRAYGTGGDMHLGCRRGPEGYAFFTRLIVGAIGYFFYQPEVLVGARFAPLNRTPNFEFLRVMGGTRFGLATRHIEFLGLFHAGGTVDMDEPTSGFIYDLGGAIDLRTSHTSVGVFSTWNHLHEQGGWMEVGLHFEYRWLQ